MTATFSSLRSRLMRSVLLMRFFNPHDDLLITQRKLPH
jgi:hypothetical protein